VGLIKSGFSAIGKLFIIIALAGTFLVGMGSVVYMSLQGEEIKVPEITGKDFVDSEKELASLGLKIKRRADRYSTEKPNTILEQLPRPGETVKTGQMILVVTSKTNPEGQEEPTTIKKTPEEDDTEVIKDMISDDKPKKTNKNANTNTNKKKADTKRDVIGNKSNSNSNTDSAGNSNSGSSGTSTDKGNKNTSSPTTTKTPTTPTVTKTPSGGDVRPRTTPKP